MSVFDVSARIRISAAAYLDDLISWERQVWYISSITGHEVAVQDSENTLMSDDQEIILLSFELQNDGFETDSDIVVGLYER